MKTVHSQRLYKNHGKAIGWWEVEAQAEGDSAQLRITFAKTEDGAVVEKFHPIKGVNIGKANETTPHDQAIAEAKSRALKQLDKGYVASKEEATLPATNASGNKMPQLATPLEKVKPEKLDWDNAYAQPKLDGHRALGKNGLVYSRQGKEIKLPHIIEALEEAGLQNMHVDGELYSHGKVLQDIGSLIKAPREESRAIEFHLYDIVADLPFVERFAMLSQALTGAPNSFGMSTTSIHSTLHLVPTVRIDSMEAWDTLHEQWLAKQYEGSIGRFGLESYLDGKRSRNTIKRKDFSDAEFKVIGYREGVPLVTKGATFRVPVWLLEVAPGKTFEATAHGTAPEKHEQMLEADKHVGRMLTVKFFGMTPAGIPNIATALRWFEPV